MFTPWNFHPLECLPRWNPQDIQLGPQPILHGRLWRPFHWGSMPYASGLVPFLPLTAHCSPLTDLFAWPTMALTKRGDKKAPTGRGTMADGGQGQGYGMSLAIKQFKINNAIPANPQNHQS